MVFKVFFGLKELFETTFEKSRSKRADKLIKILSEYSLDVLIQSIKLVKMNYNTTLDGSTKNSCFISLSVDVIS
jgi:hypothetical protein